MNKTLLAIATAMLAATTLFASAAEAGFKVRLGFGGPLPHFTAHGNSGAYHKPRHKRRHVVRRKAKSKVHVTKQTSTPKTSDVAKVEDKAEEKAAQNAAVNENSSISTAALPKDEASAEETAKPATDTSETATIATPKADKKVDCKKFFPSVGMTLTVPCE